MSALATTGDPRFFLRAGPFTLARVAEAAGGEASGSELSLVAVAPLQLAAANHVSFLDNRRYLPELKVTQAGAVIVHPDMRRHVPTRCTAIVTPTPYLGWAQVAALFHPVAPLRPGAHPSAVVDPAAQVDPTAEIGPLAVIGPGAEIGPGCRIGAGAVIGAGVVLGADCRVGAHASLECAILGRRVYIYPGARIGQEGFGFTTGPDGFVTVPQLGRVIIDDDVEVGANTTVDRGSAQDTVIGAGTRIDNLVQVGHNVRLGRCCIVVAQAGFSGSVVAGDFVQIGGQVGVAGHLSIGSRARVGGKAGVMNDIAPGADVVGSPAIPSRAFFRKYAVLAKLAERYDVERRQPEPPGGAGRTEKG